MKLVAEAGVGTVAAGVAEGARRRHPRSPAPTAAPGASPLSSIKYAGAPWELGLAETQQALVAERPARPRAAARRRRPQDRPRRRDRGAARRRRVRLRHRAAGGRGLHDGALLPPQHLPGRHRHPAARAARQVRRHAGAWSMHYLRFVAEEVREILAALGLRIARRGDRPRRAAPQRAPRRRAPAPRSLACRAPARAAPRRYARRSVRPTTRRSIWATASCATPRRRSSAPRSSSRLRDRELRPHRRRASGGQIGARYGAGSPPGRVACPLHGSAGQSFGAFLARRRRARPRGRGERLRRQGHERRPHRRLAPGRTTPATRARRQHRAVRRDRRRAVLRRPRRRAVRGAQLRRRRRRRGRRRPRLRVHDGRHGRGARRRSDATSPPA